MATRTTMAPTPTRSNAPIIVAIIAGAIALIALTAMAATYLARPATPEPAKQVTVIHRNSGTHYANQQPVARDPACDDKNIVGTGLGAVAGGVLGNQIGGGKGRTVATVGGALGGAYLGNEYLPTRNVTCR